MDTPRRTKRHRRWRLLELLLLPLLVLGVSAFAYARLQGDRSVATVEVQPLTFSLDDRATVINEFPVASPDGKYVLFQRSSDPQVLTTARGQRVTDFTDASDWDIYRIGTDGSGLVRLTDHPALEDQAVWSPDSQTIVYRFINHGSHDIWLMDADGTHKRPLVADPHSDEKAPAFSGDGTRVVFFSNRDGQPWNLYTIELASRRIERLTAGPFEDKHPQFTADGQEVIFHSDRSADGLRFAEPGQDSRRRMDIHALHLASGAIRPLTDASTLADNRHPFLSPNDRFIVYHANRLQPSPDGGLYEKVARDLYIMTRDGRRRVNLTASDSRTFKHPSWAADGRGIYCAFKRPKRAWNIGYIEVAHLLRQLAAPAPTASAAQPEGRR